MASYYDPGKKCRVGVMDEHQFYSEASGKNGKFFQSLIEVWQKKGGRLKWGAGGVGLRCEVSGKEIGICFLAPAFARKKDRIELSLTPLSRQIGEPVCTKLKAALQEAAGDCFRGSSMISVVEPGTLPANRQKLVTSALCKVL